jgi:hypothetical protein
MKKLGWLGLGALALLAAPSRSEAVTFNFSGVSGSGSGDILQASVEFLVSGTTLTVIVTNTDDNAAFNGADVLSSVYFDIVGNPTLSNGNATLTSGSSLVLKNNQAPGSTNPLNNEWYYEAPNTAVGRMYSFGATGAIGFSPQNDSFDIVFQNGTGTGGANDDYGIVPTLGITVGSNTNVYANNSMTFTFDLSSTISESDIVGVSVSYGSNGTTVLVPEPASVGAIAAGLIAMLARRRSKR